MDAAPDAVLRLLARAIGEPHDRERGLLTRAQVGLEPRRVEVEAHERERDRAAEHPPTVRPNPLQHCAAYVTTEERGRSPEPLRPEGDSFAREAKRVPRCRTQKKGAGGGNMVSPHSAGVVTSICQSRRTSPSTTRYPAHSASISASRR